MEQQKASMRHSNIPNNGDLLDLILDWIPQEDVRNRILRDNAHELYGFD